MVVTLVSQSSGSDQEAVAKMYVAMDDFCHENETLLGSYPEDP